jgi:uncharacterized protein YceK
MCRRALTCLAAVAAAGLSGCGTSLNLDGDSRVYGGVVQDFQIAKERLAQAANPSWPGTPGSSPAWNITVSALALVDLPLSLLGDTLTLPFTIPTALEGSDEPDRAKTSTDSGGGKGTPSHPLPAMGW